MFDSRSRSGSLSSYAGTDLARTHFAPLILAAAWLAGGLAVPAQSGEPTAPREVLPDLDQVAPASVSLQNSDTGWRIGFSSEVRNVGPGPLRLRGEGPGNAPMTADQIVSMSDTTTTTLEDVGEIHYVIGGGHQHWHLMEFELYELVPVEDPQGGVRDVKTGFCLANAFTADGLCQRDEPEATSVEMGLRPGGSDVYNPYLEGQYISISPATTPAGDYHLVHTTNANGALRELTPENNSASLRIALTWSGGTPAVSVLNSCPATPTCERPRAVPPRDPDPGDTELPPAPAPAPQQQEPQLVPVVAPPAAAPPLRLPDMTMEVADELARSALRKSFRRTARRVRTACTRRRPSAYTCRASWTLGGKSRWSGRIGVWYRLEPGRVVWFYNLTGTERPGSRKVRRSSARGAVRLTTTASGALVCRPLGT